MKRHGLIPEMNDAYLSTRISITGIDSLAPEINSVRRNPIFHICAHVKSLLRF